MDPDDPPFTFQCMAEDMDHAKEQLLNAEPDGVIVWIDKREAGIKVW